MSRKPRPAEAEQMPQTGGSYIRQPDGGLVQVAGPGIEEPAPEPEPAPGATQE